MNDKTTVMIIMLVVALLVASGDTHQLFAQTRSGNSRFGLLKLIPIYTTLAAVAMAAMGVQSKVNLQKSQAKEKQQNAAATAIQAVVKGKHTRNELWDHIRYADYAREVQEVAAEEIQAAVRGKQTRDNIRDMNAAATRVQGALPPVQSSFALLATTTPIGAAAPTTLSPLLAEAFRASGGGTGSIMEGSRSERRGHST